MRLRITSFIASIALSSFFLIDPSQAAGESANRNPSNNGVACQNTQSTKAQSGNSRASTCIYIVTWNANGGSLTGSPATSWTFGSVLNFPTQPVRSGYTFTGWFVSPSGGSRVDSGSYIPKFTSNFTLYAQWSANSYTVTWSANGGSLAGSASTTWTFGTPLTLPSAPSRSNYSFTGWYTDSSNGTKVGDALFSYTPMNTSNFTLYAQWEPTIRPLSIAISAGNAHTCALLNNLMVKCWGSNEKGQLGDGSTTASFSPVDVTGLSPGALGITSGLSHTCALLSTGAVKCWGGNHVGQLGDGSTTDSVLPVAVTGISSGVVAISAGSSHTCALLNTGAVRCWGYNDFSQLGDGSSNSSSSPVAVTGISSGVVAISAGSLHTCALLDTGAVRCWGDNYSGQLGDGSTTSSSSPVAVTGLSSGVVAISAGSSHTCALLNTGSVKCWGYNKYGQLGDGSTTSRSSPVTIPSLSSGTVAISSGSLHTCAVLKTGAVKCWGYNGYGQLGDGSSIPEIKPPPEISSTSPVDVMGLSSGAIAISASTFHTCTLLDTGAVICWGRNEYGQLGDGTTIQSTSPVAVVGLN